MFEIVHYRRGTPTPRELAQQLVSISAEANARRAHLETVTGLVPAVMERAAALTALECALGQEVPLAAARLRFIVDVATAAMTQIATDPQ